MPFSILRKRWIGSREFAWCRLKSFCRARRAEGHSIEFSFMGVFQLFYYPVLGFWSFYHLSSFPYIQIFWGFLTLGFLVQLTGFLKKTPSWIRSLSPFFQLASLAPLLVEGYLPWATLLFASFPMISVVESYGFYAGIFVWGLASLAAISGGVRQKILPVQWPDFLSFSLFLFAILSLSAPALDKAAKAVKRGSMMEEFGPLLEEMGDSRSVLQWLTEKAVSFIGTEFAAIYTWDPEKEQIVFHAFSGEIFTAIKDKLLELMSETLEMTAKNEKPYVANDLSFDPRYASLREKGACVASAACYPIGKNEEIKGGIVCGSTLTSSFSPFQLELLHLIAQYSSFVLAKGEWKEQKQRLLRELEAVAASCSALTSSLGLEELLHLIAGYAVQILNLQEWTLFLFDSVKKEFYPFLSTAAFQEELLGIRLTWGEGAISQAVIKKEVLMIRDLSKNPLVSDKENRKGRFLAMVAVPLIFQEKILGGILLCDSHPRTFSEEEIRFSAILGVLTGLALDKGKSVQKEEEKNTPFGQ